MDAAVAKKVHAFFETYPKRTYPKHQTVVFGGESPDKVFYLVSGRISQYDISYRGDEIIINVFKPGAFFPMTWAINKTPNLYFYKSDEPAEVHVAPPEDVVDFLKANPDVMFDLLSRVYRGTDGVLQRMVRLMSSSAQSRLMFELIIECRRFGEKLSDNSMRLALSESDLASRSGLARETISREIKSLKSRGIIQIEDGSIIVSDLKQLEERLGQHA